MFPHTLALHREHGLEFQSWCLPDASDKAIGILVHTIKETPLKLNWASSGVFIKGTLQDQRQAVANDLGGGIPEVDILYIDRAHPSKTAIGSRY